MIRVTDVTKRYGDFVAVDSASVEIEPRTITSFVGPNGAGKSTLLGIISRLIPKDSGSVHVDGTEVSAWKTQELAKKISILKQTNHINVRLSVRDLVGFGRFPYSQGRLTKEDRDHVERAIAYMNLEHLADKFLDQLSGGERQRAFIAMVIAQDTDYVLLDEPLNNLDMKHSVQIMQVLRRLVDELGKTVVLVLHDINFASVYSDRIVAMRDGRVVGSGPVSEMICPEMLRAIYDMDIRIQELECRKVCVYFW